MNIDEEYNVDNTSVSISCVIDNTSTYYAISYHSIITHQYHWSNYSFNLMRRNVMLQSHTFHLMGTNVISNNFFCYYVNNNNNNNNNNA